MVRLFLNICSNPKNFNYIGSYPAAKYYGLDQMKKLADCSTRYDVEKGEYISNGSFNNQQKYSYCGPGTKYQQRANEGYNGINELDSMCKLHDRFYNENTDTKSRNVSDLALAHRADEIAKSSMFDATQRRDAKFVSGIMKNKARFGLGVGVSKSSKSKD